MEYHSVPHKNRVLNKSDKNSQARLVRVATALRDQLGFGDLDGMPISRCGDFVQHFPEYEVRVINLYENARFDFGKLIFTGADFQKPNNPEIFGKLIVLVYDHAKKHFSFMSHKKYEVASRPMHLSKKTTVRLCGVCHEPIPIHYGKYKVDTQENAWSRHVCEGRKACKGCRNNFEPDALKQHQSNKDRRLCTQCGEMCYGEYCLTNHNIRCFQAPKCGVCHLYHAEGEECELPCSSCGKRMTMKQMLEHVDFINDGEGHKRAAKKRKLNNGCAADDESDDETLEDGAFIHYAFDLETARVETGIVPKQTPDAEIARASPVKMEVSAVCIFPLGGDVDRDLMYWDYRDDAEQRFYEFITSPMRSEEIKNGKKGRVLWAHNGAKFDFRILMNFAIKKGLDAKMIKNDATVFAEARVITLQIGVTKFMDSNLHFTNALKNLPKMFDFVDLSKGHFPHLFNVPANFDYDGPLPPLAYYEPEKHKPKDCNDIIAWWHSEEPKWREGGWNYRQQQKEYCVMDVLVLEKALQAYRTLMMDQVKFDPLNSLTAPAVAMTAFRKKYLKDSKIQIPMVMRSLALQTGRKELNMYELLKDCYFGGNTNLRRVWLELTPEQKAAGGEIRARDVVSLYPSAMYNHLFPTGKLTLHEFTPDNQPSEEFILQSHGAMRCWIRWPSTRPPPFHPVLRRIRDGKLCCSLEEPTEASTHTMAMIHAAIEQGYEIGDVEWMVVAEDPIFHLFNEYIAKFLALKTLNGGLPDSLKKDQSDEFAREWMRRAEETSGMKVDAINAEELRAAFKKNSGLKSLAKLLLNSLYGKFGENPFRNTTTFASDPDTIEELIGGRDEFIDVFHASETLTGVVTRNTAYPSRPLKTASVLIAAYVTDYGAIALNKGLEKLGENVLYHDTDSVFYYWQPGYPDIEIGEHLGEWSDDLEGAKPDAFVAIAPKSYALMKREGEKEKLIKIRMKGITITHENAQRLTWDQLAGMAHAMMDPNAKLGGQSDSVDVHHQNWSWKRDACEFTIQETYKTLRANRQHLKGKLARNGVLYPFGAERFECWNHVEWV